MNSDDKLLDLYGISQSEARFYWKAGLYVDVLRDKKLKATNLQKLLNEEPMLKRDSNRIRRIGEHIAHLNVLLKEVE